MNIDINLATLDYLKTIERSIYGELTYDPDISFINDTSATPKTIILSDKVKTLDPRIIYYHDGKYYKLRTNADIPDLTKQDVSELKDFNKVFVQLKLGKVSTILNKIDNGKHQTYIDNGKITPLQGTYLSAPILRQFYTNTKDSSLDEEQMILRDYDNPTERLLSNTPKQRIDKKVSLSYIATSPNVTEYDINTKKMYKGEVRYNNKGQAIDEHGNVIDPNIYHIPSKPLTPPSFEGGTGSGSGSTKKVVFTLKTVQKSRQVKKQRYVKKYRTVEHHSSSNNCPWWMWLIAILPGLICNIVDGGTTESTTYDTEEYWTWEDYYETEYYYVTYKSYTDGRPDEEYDPDRDGSGTITVKNPITDKVFKIPDGQIPSEKYYMYLGEPLSNKVKNALNNTIDQTYEINKDPAVIEV